MMTTPQSSVGRCYARLRALVESDPHPYRFDPNAMPLWVDVWLLGSVFLSGMRGHLVVPICLALLLRFCAIPAFSRRVMAPLLTVCAVVQRALQAHYGDTTHVAVPEPENEKEAVRAARTKQWTALQARLDELPGRAHIDIGSTVDVYEPLMAHNETMLRAHGYALVMNHCNARTSCLLRRARDAEGVCATVHLLDSTTRARLTANEVFIVPFLPMIALLAVTTLMPFFGLMALVSAPLGGVATLFLLGVQLCIGLTGVMVFFAAGIYNTVQWLIAATAVLNEALDAYSHDAPSQPQETQRPEVTEQASGAQWQTIERILRGNKGAQHISVCMQDSTTVITRANQDKLLERGYRVHYMHCPSSHACLLLDLC